MPLSDKAITTGLLMGRLLLAALFLHEGWIKLTSLDATAAYMAKFSVPWAALPFALLAEIGGGVCLLLGWQTRLAGLVLAGFSIVAALLFHTIHGSVNERLHFEKDIALAGGLLLVALGGEVRSTWTLIAHLFQRKTRHNV